MFACNVTGIQIAKISSLYCKENLLEGGYWKIRKKDKEKVCKKSTEIEEDC